jgi:hypothetical protein
VDSEVVFDIAVLVKTIIAVGAEVHGVVPLRGLIVDFFGEVDALFTAHVRDGIGLHVDMFECLGRALAVCFHRVLSWGF